MISNKLIYSDGVDQAFPHPVAFHILGLLAPNVASRVAPFVLKQIHYLWVRVCFNIFQAVLS
jgi:hypothetical protein